MVYYSGIKMKTWQKIFYWLLGIFVIYLIYELIRKILGGSLGFDELVIGLLIANLGYIIAFHAKISYIDSKLSGHLGWHKGKENPN